MPILNWLTTFSVRRASVVVLITIAIVLLGVYSTFRVKTELIPNIEFPAMTVVTRYPGAGPGDVAAQVTRPLEQIVAGLPGVKDLQSVSGEGVSVIVANFEFGEDMKRREGELATRLQGVPLPEGAGRPQVVRASFSQVPIVQLSVSSDTVTGAALETLVRERLVPRLSEVNGVASVEMSGGLIRQVSVALDPDQLRRFGLSAGAVARFITNTNVSSASGAVVTAERVQPVRTEYEFASVSDLAALQIAAPDGRSVRLDQIGTVQITPAPASGLVVTDGKRALGVNVFKSEGGNTVEAANSAISRARQFERDNPGVSVEPIVDQSDFIENSIQGLLREGLFGGLFAVIIVFVFLGSVRATLVTAVSIPLSILIALIVMNLQGLTINIFTLGGLTIAVGRVIDDSIVVLENVVRHVQMGERVRTAVIRGVREVSTAITSSTLTAVAVFLPIALVGGLVGQLFLAFALAVTAALLASLLVAITIVPVLAGFFVRPAEVHGRSEREAGWLQRWYTPVLEWSLDHRPATLGIAAALFFGSFGLLPFLPLTFLPDSGENVFQVSVTPPPGSSSEAVERTVLEIGSALEGLDGFERYQATIGQTGGTFATLGAAFSGRGSGGALVVVKLRDDANLDRAVERTRAAVGDIQQRTGSFIAVDSQGGPPGLGDVQIILRGSDPVAIRSASDQVVKALDGHPDLANLTSDVARSTLETVVRVDPARAAALGVSVADVAREVRLLTSGTDVTRIVSGAETLDVHVGIAAGGSGVDIARLREYPIGTARSAPLGDIATLEVREGQAQVTRFDGAPAATIRASVTADNTQSVTSDVRGIVDDLELPPGVEVEYGGIFSQFSDSFQGLILAIAISIILVYIVMVAFFGSLVDPFVILLSLPLASVGALGALVVTQRSLGVPALIGVLMLVGIVVTNAIVLLDFVHQLRKRGMPLREALIHGGQTRVRPILMTALATILGLVPLSLGFTKGAIVAAELATVVIGGLLTSTLLTLVVIPVLYSLTERFRRAPAEAEPEA